MLSTFHPITPKLKPARTHFLKILNALAQFYMGAERQPWATVARIFCTHHGGSSCLKKPTAAVAWDLPIAPQGSCDIHAHFADEETENQVKYWPQITHTAGGRSRT